MLILPFAFLSWLSHTAISSQSYRHFVRSVGLCKTCSVWCSSGPLGLWLYLCLWHSGTVRVRDIVLRESCPRNWFDFCDTIELFIGLKLKWKPRDSRRKCFHVVSCDRSHRQLWATVMPGQGRRQSHKNAIHGRADKAGRETIIYSWKLYAYVTVKALSLTSPTPPPLPLLSHLKHLVIC